MGSQQFCLRWNNHQSAVMSGFSKLLENETLVDVTIACAGVRIKAHKVVLSACSPYFQEIFEENPCKHPVIILKGFTFQDLKSIIDFMYKGEVNVNQQNLADFLKMAEELQVSGLMDVPSHHHQQLQQQQQQDSGRGETTRNHHNQETTEGSSRGISSSKEENDTNTGSARDFVARSRDRVSRTIKRGGGGGIVVPGDDYNQPVTAVVDETPIKHLDRMNDRMDSDDAIPICPVDAELHIKEEIEFFDQEDDDDDESSRLLLERLTRPAATSGRLCLEQTSSNVSSYDLATTSSSHDLPPTVEMLESLPGHSSWNVTQISHDGEPAPKILKQTQERLAVKYGGETSGKKKESSGNAVSKRDTGNNCEKIVIIHARKLRSIVWDHFSITVDPAGNRLAQCRHCSRTYSQSAKANMSTGNLIRHLNTIHYDLLQPIQLD